MFSTPLISFLLTRTLGTLVGLLSIKATRPAELVAVGNQPVGVFPIMEEGQGTVRPPVQRGRGTVGPRSECLLLIYGGEI